MEFWLFPMRLWSSCDFVLKAVGYMKNKSDDKNLASLMMAVFVSVELTNLFSGHLFFSDFGERLLIWNQLEISFYRISPKT